MIKNSNTNKTFNMRGKKIFSNLFVQLIFAGAFCFLTQFVLAQKPVNPPLNFDFEGTVTNPWNSVGNEITLTNKVVYQGKQSLEVAYATSAECLFIVEPNSTYRVSAFNPIFNTTCLFLKKFGVNLAQLNYLKYLE
jgi:hypothetical protein